MGKNNETERLFITQDPEVLQLAAARVRTTALAINGVLAATEQFAAPIPEPHQPNTYSHGNTETAGQFQNVPIVPLQNAVSQEA